MKISVITAVRNARATIGETIDSVRSQEYMKREHVVVDGLSTDGTLDILAQNAQFIDVLRSEEDRGIYDAFNKGLRLSSGEIIGFLNSDDTYVSSTVLADVAASFSRDDVDIVFGDVIVVRPDNVSAVIRHYRSQSFQPSRLARGFMPAHPAMFVRRSLYDRYGHYDISYRIAGDFEWTARVFSRGSIKFGYLPKTLVRMRHGGVSTQGLKSTIQITREMYRACRELGIRTSYARLVSRLPVKAMQYLFLSSR